MTRRIWYTLAGFALLIGVAYAQVEVHTPGEDPWWRVFNPSGQSYGVSYGTTRPTNPGPGEIFVDMDGDGDGGPQIEIYDHVNDEWNSLNDNDTAAGFTIASGSGTENTLVKFDGTPEGADSSITDDGTTVDFTVANLAFTANTVTADNGIQITANSANNIVMDASGFVFDTTGSLQVDFANSADANQVEITQTIPITASGETTNVLSLELTNANHTGGAVHALNIGGITGDAQASEHAIHIGDGWDTAIDLSDDAAAVFTFSNNGTLTISDVASNDLSLALSSVDGNDSYQFGGMAWAGADFISIQPAFQTGTTSIDILQVDVTGTAMDGSDTQRLAVLDIANADHTGTGNTLTGLDFVAITSDAQATEQGISIGTGWDVAIQANSPINGAGVYDDFTDFSVLQTGATAESVTDTEENFIYTGAPGVPGGVYIMRVEQSAGQALTAHVANGGLLFAPDATANDGLEIAFSPNELTGPFTFGQHGTIYFEMSLTISDISAIDGDIAFGLRNNTAFADPPTIGDTYGAFTISDNAGDLDIECDVNGGGAANDDTGVTWGDGETHVVRLEFGSDSVMSAAYVDGTAITITNCGSAGNTFEAGDKYLPYLYFTVGAEGADPGIQINYLSYGEVQS